MESLNEFFIYPYAIIICFSVIIMLGSLINFSSLISISISELIIIKNNIQF
jgi:hypothetical protein